MKAYGWRRDDTTGEAVLRGWVVREVIAMPPRPSPALTRVLRSVFTLAANVEQLLSRDGDGDGDVLRQDDVDDVDDDAGRWNDEGANDRPWH